MGLIAVFAANGRDFLRKAFPTAMAPDYSANGYPLDLDASLRYTRPKTGIDRYPFVGGDGTVSQIGWVSGFMPQMDARVWFQASGRIPTGPGSTTYPVNLTWQMTPPGLGKNV